MNRSYCSRVIIICACLAGCVYQVIHVSTQYFSYRTTTKVESQLQNTIHYPSLILCSRIYDFLNETQLAEFKTLSTSIHDLTVRKLNELTPAANESIAHCFLKIDHYQLHKLYDKNTCYTYFTVKKVLIGENVCYQFHPLKRLKYSINTMANAFNYSYLVYDLFLTNWFIKTRDLYILAHYPSPTEVKSGKIRLPVYSRKFGELVSHYRETKNWLVNRPNEELFNLLPPPYDSRCRSGYKYCRRDCMINTSLAMLSKYPFSEPVGDKSWDNNLVSDYKILSPKELENSKKMLTWTKIIRHCKENCRGKPCEIAVTSNFAYLYGEENHVIEAYNLSIWLTAAVATAYPRKITSVPEINWIEYTSGICNSLSIWFGFSVLAINPLNNIFRRTKFCRADNYLMKSGLVCYYIFCLLGFFYQSAEVCKEYFLYKTAMTIEVSNLDYYSYQSLGFCFQFKNLLNESALEFILRNKKNEFGFTSEDYSFLTIKEIFDLTPAIEDLITACGIKNSTNYELHRMDIAECLQYFSLFKAVRGMNICYYTVPRKTMRYSWTKVASSFHDTGKVYDLITSIRLNKPTLLTLISYDALRDDDVIWYKLPLESRNFAHKVMVFQENIITACSFTSSFVRLPKPYDTKCRSNFNFQKCLAECVNKELQSVNRKAYFELYTTSLNENIFNAKDILNESMASFGLNAFRSCKIQCSGNSCQQTVSFTSARIHRKTNYNYLIFASVLEEILLKDWQTFS